MPTLMHELASTCLPNPLLPLTCLCSGTALKICLCGSSPISALTHPHTSTPLPLNMLTILLCPPDILLMPEPHLCEPPPYVSAPPPFTIFMLTYPSNPEPHLCPPPCFSAAYNPYAHVVPSRNASDAALIPPYAFAPPPYLLCPLQSLHSCSALKISLQHRHLIFHIRSIGYGGLLAYMMITITEIC
ncbi:hypothetical protein O181_100056 [Austropuccinia psidii MF-1]|uniref:Uncharacterized protein n=1 Tax=Austropuccinia psidii MF-1 TaxID=1389203 RepID=A0A9Q3JEM7_9BASI|nr:hypothetical protein [Austropuccinia psidii MF-1]